MASAISSNKPVTPVAIEGSKSIPAYEVWYDLLNETIEHYQSDAEDAGADDAPRDRKTGELLPLVLNEWTFVPLQVFQETFGTAHLFKPVTRNLKKLTPASPVLSQRLQPIQQAIGRIKVEFIKQCTSLRHKEKYLHVVSSEMQTYLKGRVEDPLSLARVYATGIRQYILDGPTGIQTMLVHIDATLERLSPLNSAGRAPFLQRLSTSHARSEESSIRLLLELEIAASEEGANSGTFPDILTGGALTLPLETANDLRCYSLYCDFYCTYYLFLACYADSYLRKVSRYSESLLHHLGTTLPSVVACASLPVQPYVPLSSVEVLHILGVPTGLPHLVKKLILTYCGDSWSAKAK